MCDLVVAHDDYHIDDTNHSKCTKFNKFNKPRYT